MTNYFLVAVEKLLNSFFLRKTQNSFWLFETFLWNVKTISWNKSLKLTDTSLRRKKTIESNVLHFPCGQKASWYFLLQKKLLEINEDIAKLNPKGWNRIVKLTNISPRNSKETIVAQTTSSLRSEKPWVLKKWKSSNLISWRIGMKTTNILRSHREETAMYFTLIGHILSEQKFISNIALKTLILCKGKTKRLQCFTHYMLISVRKFFQVFSR